MWFPFHQAFISWLLSICTNHSWGPYRSAVVLPLSSFQDQNLEIPAAIFFHNLFLFSNCDFLNSNPLSFWRVDLIEMMLVSNCGNIFIILDHFQWPIQACDSRVISICIPLTARIPRRRYEIITIWKRTGEMSRFIILNFSWIGFIILVFIFSWL